MGSLNVRSAPNCRTSSPGLQRRPIYRPCCVIHAAEYNNVNYAELERCAIGRAPRCRASNGNSSEAEASAGEGRGAGEGASAGEGTGGLQRLRTVSTVGRTTTLNNRASGTLTTVGGGGSRTIEIKKGGEKWRDKQGRGEQEGQNRARKKKQCGIEERRAGEGKQLERGEERERRV